MSTMTLLVTVLHPLAAQTRSVRGTVIDHTTRAPIVGARVSSQHTEAVATTDGLGRFVLSMRRDDGDSLRVIRIGYRPVGLVVERGDTLVQVEMHLAPVVLQTVVSLATRRSQSTADLATPVLTLSHDDIVASGAQGLDALLQDVPGVQHMSEPPARSTLQIRGIGGSRVLVLVDGEPVAGAMIEDRDLSRISLGTAAQVEVVKGPLSVVHGSEALGGVINVVTRAPNGPLTIRGTVGTGTDGRRNAQIESGSGGAVPWHLSLAHRSMDQVATQLPRPDALQRVWDVRGGAQTDLSPTVTLRISGSALRERQRWPIDATINGFNDNTAWNLWIESARTTATSSVRARFSMQEFAHQYREAAGKVPYAGTGAPVQRERAGRALLTLTRPLGGGHVIDAGIEASARRVEAPDRLIGGVLHDTGLDAWVQDAWQAGVVLVTLAGRQSWSSRWGSTFTPALTGAVEPGPTLRLYGSVARGYRGPSFKESGWNFSNAGAGYVVEGNAELVPEHSWQFSAGATWQPVSALVIDAEVFRNDLRELIDLRLQGTNPAGLQRYRPINVARARTQGLDVHLRHRLGAVRTRLSWSWLATRDASTGASLPDRIPHALRLTADVPVGPVDLTLRGSWRAAVPAGTEGVAVARGDFLAWDAALRWPVNPALELQAGVDNLFDAVPSGWHAPIGRALRVAITSSWQP